MDLSNLLTRLDKVDLTDLESRHELLNNFVSILFKVSELSSDLEESDLEKLERMWKTALHALKQCVGNGFKMTSLLVR